MQTWRVLLLAATVTAALGQSGGGSVGGAVGGSTGGGIGGSGAGNTGGGSGPTATGSPGLGRDTPKLGHDPAAGARQAERPHPRPAGA